MLIACFRESWLQALQSVADSLQRQEKEKQEKENQDAQAANGGEPDNDLSANDKEKRKVVRA